MCVYLNKSFKCPGVSKRHSFQAILPYIVNHKYVLTVFTVWIIPHSNSNETVSILRLTQIKMFCFKSRTLFNWVSS